MRFNDTIYNIKRWIFYDRIPVTKILLIANVITMFLVGLFRFESLVTWLGFNAAGFFFTPWSALTYPLISFHPLNLIFSGLWLWWIGGSLERSWGTRVFGIFFFAMSAISVLGLTVGGLLAGIPLSNVTMVGIWLPLAAITMAWATINPDEYIRLWCILPVKLKWIAIAEVVIILFTFGKLHPLYGVFALAGCAASYWYTRYGRYMTDRAPARRDDNIIRIHPPHARRTCRNPLRWFKEYREDKRLRDFLNK